VGKKEGSNRGYKDESASKRANQGQRYFGVGATNGEEGFWDNRKRNKTKRLVRVVGRKASGKTLFEHMREKKRGLSLAS